MTPKPIDGHELVTDSETIIQSDWKRWHPLCKYWESAIAWGFTRSHFASEIYSRPIPPTIEDRLKLLESGFDNHENRLRELQEVNSVSLTDTLVNAIIDNCAG